FTKGRDESRSGYMEDVEDFSAITVEEEPFELEEAPMLSVGLDLHKRYSQVEAIDEVGERRAAARIGNEQQPRQHLSAAQRARAKMARSLVASNLVVAGAHGDAAVA